MTAVAEAIEAVLAADRAASTGTPNAERRSGFGGH
jgi:hypothetical protein